MAREDDAADDGITSEEPLDTTAREEANAIMDDDFAPGSVDGDILESPDDAGDGVAGDLSPLIDGDEALDGAAADAAAKPAEGVDRGDGRDTKGKFATEKAAADAPADKATDAAKPDATAAAAPSAEAKPAEQPKWEPLKVRVDKEDVTIPEATITKHGGYHMVGIKDADFPAFASRMSKAVAAERMWRDLNQGLKTLDAERAAPQPKSDEQIEAELTLAAIKQFIPEILTQEQVDNLELRIKLAQRDAKDAHTTARKEYFDKLAEKEREANQPAEDEQAQLQGIATELLDCVTNTPELQGITEQEIRAAYADLIPYRKALFWKEQDGWYVNRDQMLKVLRSKKGTASSTAKPEATPAPAGTTADASTKPAGDTKPDKDEQFNRRQNSAAAPTTSVKANRDTPTPRATGAPPRAGKPREREKVATKAMDAEDHWRKSTRSFLSSDSLEFEGDDDS